jgi:hypothetical protein
MNTQAIMTTPRRPGITHSITTEQIVQELVRRRAHLSLVWVNPYSQPKQSEVRKNEKK